MYTERYEGQAEVARQLQTAIDGYVRAIRTMDDERIVTVDEIFALTRECDHEPLRAAIWMLHDEGNVRVRQRVIGNRAELILELLG